jgi:hypothetical protein
VPHPATMAQGTATRAAPAGAADSPPQRLLRPQARRRASFPRGFNGMRRGRLTREPDGGTMWPRIFPSLWRLTWGSA